MTNLELAQQQGNQAAPNLLAAATAGELGGGSSKFPSLSTAGAVMAHMEFSLDADQADEAAANTIYNNCKLVTDNHLDVFALAETYLADGAELPTVVSSYFAFSARALTRIKNLAVIEPDIQVEIFDNIEPNELCTFEDEIAEGLEELVSYSLEYGVDELPPITSGIIMLDFIGPNKKFSKLIPVGSSVYAQLISFGEPASSNLGVKLVQYYAESLLDTPVKLDKTYSLFGPLPK